MENRNARLKETQRVIKFRIFSPKSKEFHYWGFIDGHFKGPPTGSGLTIEECSQSDRFSGLQDSKGVDIYEGDVFKWGQFIGSVVFKDGCFVFDTHDNYSMTMRDHRSNEVEVIGHIYDPKFSNLL